MTATATVSQEEMVSFVLDLAASAGFGQVAESIGVSEDDLESMVAGASDWPGRAFRLFDQMNGVLSMFAAETAGNAEPGLVSTDTSAGDWRNTPQAQQADLAAAAAAAAGITHGENLAQRAKAELYRYLEVIARRQIDPLLSEEQLLALLAYRLELELLIIMYYKDTVPLPGMNWDAVRRIHEADERVGRLTMVRDSQRRAERFFSKVRRWMGRAEVSEELVLAVAREAAAMERPLETDDDIDLIIGRSEFGRILQTAR